MRKTFIKHVFHPVQVIQFVLQHWVGIPFSRWFVNFIFQRVLRINADVAFQVHFTSQITAGSGIHIGKNVWKSFALSGGCYIQGGNGIYIGDDTIFAPGVKIISANHDKGNLKVWRETSPIRIGAHCWIGANAVILPGVELGDDCIVGAGSIVTRSFPSHSVVIGVPGVNIAKGTSNSE